MHGYDAYKTRSDMDDAAAHNTSEANEPMGSCDLCGKSKPVHKLSFLIMYGLDTYACDECRGYDEDGGE